MDWAGRADFGRNRMKYIRGTPYRSTDANPLAVIPEQDRRGEIGEWGGHGVNCPFPWFNRSFGKARCVRMRSIDCYRSTLPDLPLEFLPCCCRRYLLAEWRSCHKALDRLRNVLRLRGN